MLKRIYKNFDELFYSLNRELLLNPYMFDYVTTAIGYKENIHICCGSSDCSLNIGDFGYKMNKWTGFSKSMVVPETFKLFKDRLATTNGNCIHYVFGETDGLICVVLKRHDARTNFRTCDVYCKRSELCKHFAVDLVLLSVFLKSIPNVNLKEINIYISQGFVPATYVIAFLDYFDLGLEELEQEHPFVKAMINAKKKFFTDKENISTYEAIARVQRLYFGMYEAPNIRVLDLELGE